MTIKMKLNKMVMSTLLAGSIFSASFSANGLIDKGSSNNGATKKVATKTQNRTPLQKAFDADEAYTVVWSNKNTSNATDSKEFEYILQAVKYNKHIITLKLNNVKLSAAEFQALFKVLNKKSTLKTLDLTGVDLSKQQHQIMFLLANNTALEMITLDQKYFGKKQQIVINALQKNGIMVVWNK